MNTAAIANAAPLAPPPVPPTGSESNFSDFLASNLAAGAALPATATLGIVSGGQANPPELNSLKSGDTDTNSNGSATVAIPVPLPPHQQDSGTPSGDAAGSNVGTTSQGGNTAPQPTAAGSNGNATGAGTGNDGQNGRGGATLPPTAAQLNARVIAGAQALVSQPNSNLAALAHTAQVTPAGTAASAETSTSPYATNPAQHGATTPDPSALLKSGTGGTPPSTIAAEQDAAQATVQSAATAAARSVTSDDTGQTGGDPGAQQPDPSANSVAAPLAPQPAALLASAPTTQAATVSTLAASTLDQIAFNIRQSLRSDLNQIEIQLKPASLGSIDVKLEMTHDGRMTAVISSDRSDTLNLLQRNSGELQQALRDAGLQTDTGSLSFNLRGEQQQPGNQGQQGSSLATSASPEPGADESQSLAIATAAAAATSSHAGLLNIQV
jgi:flagellar hook-length control protein FliK